MYNPKKAFTLIELLVVIAIIAILAAILFPVFAQAKQAAKKASDLSNIKQLGTAVLIYVNDYDDHYMFSAMFPQSAGTTYGDMYRWSSTVVVGPYLKNTDILLSPLDSSYAPDATGYFSYIPPTAPRVMKPISYMSNSLSTDLLGANSLYFPAGVTDYRGPIAPGSYFDRASGSYDPKTPSVSATEATNPSTLIVFTGGSIEEGHYSGCGKQVNTETFAGCGSGDGDLYWGWDAANLASGTNFGSANADMAKAWRKAANQGNFSFSDSHAKSLAPGSLLFGPFKLNPKYFLVNSTGF